MKHKMLSGSTFGKGRLDAAENRARGRSLQWSANIPAKAVIAISCLLLCLETIPLPVYAAGISEQEASLQVEIFSQSEDGKTSSPVSGASLAAVQIASLVDSQNENAGVMYTVTDMAAKAGITDADLAQMDAAASSVIARRIANAIRAGGGAPEDLSGGFVRTAVSDDRGIASFGPIGRENFGIYVVYQTGKSRDAAKYLDIEPFLVQVPQPDTAGSGTWEYHVRTIPKLAQHTPSPVPPEKPSAPPEVPEKPVTPDKPKTPSKPTTPAKTTTKTTGGKGTSSPVKTGDLQNPALWAGIFAAAGTLLLLFALLRRKLRHREQG